MPSGPSRPRTTPRRRRFMKKPAPSCLLSRRAGFNLLVCALQGDSDKALKALAEAVRFGFEDRNRLENADELTSLRAMDGFKEILREADLCREEKFVLYAGENVDAKKPA